MKTKGTAQENIEEIASNFKIILYSYITKVLNNFVFIYDLHYRYIRSATRSVPQGIAAHEWDDCIAEPYKIQFVKVKKLTNQG